LRYEEILKIVQVAADLGIKKVRLTGGEPMVRKHLVALVDAICNISGLEDVSITTNAVFLKKMAKEIFDAGIRRINVSLDTLNFLKYARITGRAHFNQVWEGLQEAEAVGFSPIKVNVVAIRGLNDDELLRFAALSLRKPYHVRFIEYMPIGHDSQWTLEKYISSDEVKCKLSAIGPLQKMPPSSYDGPAERYCFESAAGEIGFISPLSHHFCPSCNRLRLTADGKLRPCLFADDEVDIKTPFRRACGQEALKWLFRRAIIRKPMGHDIEFLKRGKSMRSMFAIGG